MEKLFDTSKHVIFSVLEKYRFGLNYVNWIEIAVKYQHQSISFMPSHSIQSFYLHWNSRFYVMLRQENVKLKELVLWKEVK